MPAPRRSASLAGVAPRPAVASPTVPPQACGFRPGTGAGTTCPQLALIPAHGPVTGSASARARGRGRPARPRSGHARTRGGGPRPGRARRARCARGRADPSGVVSKRERPAGGQPGLVLGGERGVVRLAEVGGDDGGDALGVPWDFEAVDPGRTRMVEPDLCRLAPTDGEILARPRRPLEPEALDRGRRRGIEVDDPRLAGLEPAPDVLPAAGQGEDPLVDQGHEIGIHHEVSPRGVERRGDDQDAAPAVGTLDQPGIAAVQPGGNRCGAAVEAATGSTRR